MISLKLQEKSFHKKAKSSLPVTLDHSKMPPFGKLFYIQDIDKYVVLKWSYYFNLNAQFCKLNYTQTKCKSSKIPILDIHPY